VQQEEQDGAVETRVGKFHRRRIHDVHARLRLARQFCAQIVDLDR